MTLLVLSRRRSPRAPDGNRACEEHEGLCIFVVAVFDANLAQEGQSCFPEEALERNANCWSASKVTRNNGTFF